MLNIKAEDIRYIVEYWEQDSLDIDDNQHILFVLPKQELDIIVTKENIEMINRFLSAMGGTMNANIKISLEGRVNFFDRLIYPAKFYGERFYKCKYGGLANRIRRMFGLSIPLEVREKWR